MKLVNILLIICLFLIVLASVLLQETGGLQLSSFQSNDEDTKVLDWKFIFISLSMLIGIFSGEFYSKIENKDSNKITLSDIKEFVFEKSLWRSLIASPLLFGGIYTMSKGQPDIIMSILFAFENGFFCNIILSKKKRDLMNESQ